MTESVQISQLLSHWEDLREQGRSITAEELCHGCPERLETVRRCIQALEQFPATADGSTSDGTGARTAPPAAPQLRGYEILGELGRGGMGVVYRARQVALNRVVALKMILAGSHAAAADRARFRREAEAIARLQHPHIVQIHEVGDDGSRPYLVLEHMDGGSLWHKTGGMPQPPRAAAGLVELLARAMGYAHQRGIVHRDLKPANVLLTQGGAPKIADFGLAKLLEAETGTAERSAPTGTGAVLGTPGYMAPEQALGKVGEVGPAADVYALGAILYQQLTGRPPFQAATPLATLEQVIRAEPVPPRRLQPAVPRDLDTICLHCLRKEPARRYASADDLADDLARYLRGEPVRARPIGPVGRLIRWSRRNPVVALFAGLAASALVAVAIISLVFALHARQAEVDARWQREQTEAHFQQAKKAVDVFFAKVTQSKLGNTPGTQALRQELLQTALTFYLDFVRQREDDPTLRAELADTYRKIARLVRETGSIDEALAWHEQGIALRRRLVAELPDEVAQRRDLADHLFMFAPDLRRAGKLPEALRAIEEAIAILSELNQGDPADEQTEDLLARAYTNLGLIEGSLSRPQDATRSTRKGLEVMEAMLRHKPGDRLVRYNMGVAYNNIGLDYSDQGHGGEALAMLGRARELLEEIVRQDAANPATEYVRVVEGRDMLAAVHLNLGLRHRQGKRLEAALASYQEALGHYEKLHRENPTVKEHQFYFAHALVDVAYTQWLLGHPDQAGEGYARARGVAEKLLRQEPQSVRYLNQVGVTWDGSAIVLAGRKERSAALAAFAEALDHHQRAAARAKDSGDTSFFLSQHYQLLGRAHREWQEPAAALDAARRRRAVAGRVPQLLVETAEDLALCIPLIGKGAATPSATDDAERRQVADEAMALLKQAVAEGFDDTARLRDEPALAVLRPRADFSQLLQALRRGTQAP